MKQPVKPTKQPHNLAAWLTDSRADEYFGATFVMRFEILASIQRGQRPNLAEIGRKYGVSRAAASAQHVRARRIFNLEASTES